MSSKCKLAGSKRQPKALWRRRIGNSPADRYGIRSTSLQRLALNERLVITERPFNVRPARPDEESQIDAFVGRFENQASYLPR